MFMSDRNMRVVMIVIAAMVIIGLVASSLRFGV